MPRRCWAPPMSRSTAVRPCPRSPVLSYRSRTQVRPRASGRRKRSQQRRPPQYPDVTERSDEQLLVDALADGEAFAEFYRRHAATLLGYLTRRAGDAEVAADLTAETFAAALEGLPRFKPALGPASAWLYGIARHKLARTLERGRVEDAARRKLGAPRLGVGGEAIERIQ